MEAGIKLASLEDLIVIDLIQDSIFQHLSSLDLLALSSVTKALCETVRQALYKRGSFLFRLPPEVPSQCGALRELDTLLSRTTIFPLPAIGLRYGKKPFREYRPSKFHSLDCRDRHEGLSTEDVLKMFLHLREKIVWKYFLINWYRPLEVCPVTQFLRSLLHDKSDQFQEIELIHHCWENPLTPGQDCLPGGKYSVTAPFFSLLGIGEAQDSWPSLKNLKSFVFSQLKNPSVVSQCSVQFVEGVITQAPNLERLSGTLKFYNSDFYFNSGTLKFKLFRILTQFPHRFCAVHPEKLMRIASSEPKLEAAHLQDLFILGPEGLDILGAVGQLLRSSSRTLKRVFCSPGILIRLNGMGISPMPNVEFLQVTPPKLWGLQDDHSQRTWRELKYLEKVNLDFLFPNLKTFFAQNFPVNARCEDDPLVHKAEELEGFQRFQSQAVASARAPFPESRATFVRLFPRLRAFTDAGLINFEFWEQIQAWKDLDACISGFYPCATSLDQILLGIMRNELNLVGDSMGADRFINFHWIPRNFSVLTSSINFLYLVPGRYDPDSGISRCRHCLSLPPQKKKIFPTFAARIISIHRPNLIIRIDWNKFCSTILDFSHVTEYMRVIQFPVDHEIMRTTVLVARPQPDSEMICGHNHPGNILGDSDLDSFRELLKQKKPYHQRDSRVYP